MSSIAELPDFLKLNSCWTSELQLKAIIEGFGSVEYALKQPRQAWENTNLFNKNQLDKLFSTTVDDEVAAAQTWADELNQGWITISDDRYPAKLKQISDPPIIFGYRGDHSLLNDPQLAIVGSRHASKSGKETAKDFAAFLSKQGITITSGLALGIDTAAHQGGLDGVGKTVAVVATGLDRIYPASNQNLGREIVEQGLMISEFPLGTKPLNYNFPKRNRIISGLSLGTLVVEAAVKSGSLITARTALEQGREVFAVPGSIHNPQAKGCHQLIKQGAKLVESGEDILQELAIGLEGALKDHNQLDLELAANSQEKKQDQSSLLDYIDYDPVSLDELVVLTKLPVSSIQSELLMLELSGKVEAMSAARWRRLK